ncbi:MAG: hypothetical protein KIT84_11985 [Labilithrix sp.]|nr:hypothetical protein [Labilithrix sp.]MCW5811731.1 hypothetical protein [Labilithrix sp.]
MRALLPLFFVALAACAPAYDEDEDAPAVDVANIAGCTTIGEAEVPLATARADGEMVLTLDAQALSRTSWAEKGNEAVVLEVRGGGARVGHLVLHQGADAFGYGMHVGALKKGDALTIKVSSLSAPRAARGACISNAKLAAPAPDMAEGVAHAPILKWPAQKSFNDLPVLTGWSRKGKSYQLTYTHEDGGTVELCGGGARGMRSEIARWGRGLDMEGGWSYGGAGKFGRCTGGVAPSPGAPRMESEHPVLYYGDGHNRLFESRGGYGQKCGTSRDNKTNGDLDGWNKNNPGNDAANDDPFTIVLRPIPVDGDAIGMAELGGRREGLVDTYAPWLYRLVDSELKREGRVDGALTFSMERYLFADVYADDVGGSGDETCGPIPFVPGVSRVTGGFRLNVETRDGKVARGPQMTASYFAGGSGVKRIAIPLPEGVEADDIVKVVFDAYDDDGIYFLALGDAFIPRADKSNGAVLDYVNKGLKRADVYVDDDRSGCVDGKNTKNGVAYPCAGSAFTLKLRD